MHLNRRAMLAAAALAPVAAHAANTPAAKPTPPTLEELFRAPEMLDAAISPDGEQLAVLHVQKDGEKRVAFVTLHKMADLAAKPAVVKLGDRDVSVVEWANNERLLIWVTFHADAKGVPYGLMTDAGFVLVPVRRVISVNLAGGDMVPLFANSKVIKRGFDAASIVDFMKDDPRRVLMQAWNDSRNAFSLYHVDVYTGAATLLENGVGATDFWLTQAGVPMLRFDSNRRGTVMSIFGRAPGETQWKLVRKARRDEFRKLPDFDVVGPTEKAGVFLVSQAVQGRDHKVVRSFDVSTMQFGEVVAERSGREITSAFVDENLKLVASAYWEDRLGYEFADKALAAHFRGINTALGNELNVALFDVNLDHSRLLLKMSGPREPGAFYLYDRAKKGLEPIGAMQPWLTPERLAATTPVQVKTRDGAAVTAYLTAPIDAPNRPLPMVVVPHGGPEVRDYLDWDTTVQALAARGWLVLQVNWRGSGGFGKTFAELGRKQWNGRMQEDLEDAVDQVIASGRVDAKRVAIFGASYGGYTALMQAVRRPDLYKAVVSVAGDADLVESIAITRKEEGADSPAYAYWLSSIGDPATDREMMMRASPALRAAEIKAPLLLIHGTEDTVVDPKQSKIMAKAMKAAGKPCQHIELKGVGHNWSTETAIKILESAGDFIAKAI